MTLELAIALLVAAGAVYFLFFRKKPEVTVVEETAPYKVDTPVVTPEPVKVEVPVAEPVQAPVAETTPAKAKKESKPKAAKAPKTNAKAEPKAKAKAKTAKAPKKANIRVAK